MAQTVGIIGGGSWATALVKLFSNNLENVNWWIRNSEYIKYIETYHHNPRYLSSAKLDVSKLTISSQLETIIDKSDVLVMVIPSAFIFSALSQQNPEIFKKKIIISAIKGMIPETHQIPANYFQDHFKIPEEKIGMIGGPCHAEEVAMEKLSYLTVAHPNSDFATWFADQLNCRYLKTTVSSDVVGTEISVVLKNVFAVASGICHGLAYGDNFQAVLVSNAIREIKAFVDVVAPGHREVTSSAYLGDLLVTAYSQFSRNRNFGSMVGKGYSVKSAQIEMNMVAEGYYAVKSIVEMNKQYAVPMPITQAVYNIVYDKISPTVEMRILSDKLN